ncbi:glucan biosynthesis protein G [Hyphomicrobium sp.]|uniref:glucan biosynthesis protein n=1 Tax=Hyphomicrobium sp. TaxID=82 RepID=UPI0025C4ED3B|nr:glucan biosynthesis protein G [Hyphomicrobium sp.]
MTAGAFAMLGASMRAGALSRALAEPVTDSATAFSPTLVQNIAQQLSTSEFASPSLTLPDSFKQLSYDQFRDVRFRTEQAIWRGDKIDFELQLLPMGWLYNTPVEVWLVDGGSAKRLKADSNLFSLGPLIKAAGPGAPYGFSGFRVHGPINRPDYFDEYVVFQGASYFRAVGRGQLYGMSARGLAINTARPGGEEFPLFRSFWIEKPKPGERSIVIHAVLDSESTTGAYRFQAEPGEATTIDVEATLYPRRQLTHVGIGPLTSMYLHGPGHHRIDDDFRPAVHDSDGLAIYNGNSECIWRPLTNPRTLQTSAFLDSNVKGFGLCQRARSFHSYEDLEARYERRPTVWIEPKGTWGAGYVELIEIPTSEEIHDNIVAYWKPAKGLEPGTPFSFSYRMYWTNTLPIAWSGASAAATRVGRGKLEGATKFVVDFTGPALTGQRQMPVAVVTAYPGTVSDISVHENPEANGVRVSFELDPGGTELSELRLALRLGDQQISETWLYRWTKS